MGRLVDDLLLLARLDQGRPLEREPVDLGGLVADAVLDAARRRPRAGPSTDLADRPSIVLGDEHRLRQVVANLVANALRPHAAAARRCECSCARRRATSACWRSRPRPGHGARRRGTGLRALLPGRPVALARPRRDRARPGDRAAIVEAHGGRCASTPRPARARPCASSCRSTRARRRRPHPPPRARPPSARADGSRLRLRDPTSRRAIHRMRRSRRSGPDRPDRSSRPCSGPPGPGRAA